MRGLGTWRRLRRGGGAPALLSLLKHRRNYIPNLHAAAENGVPYVAKAMNTLTMANTEAIAVVTITVFVDR